MYNNEVRLIFTKVSLCQISDRLFPMKIFWEKPRISAIVMMKSNPIWILIVACLVIPTDYVDLMSLCRQNLCNFNENPSGTTEILKVESVYEFKDFHNSININPLLHESYEKSKNSSYELNYQQIQNFYTKS